MTHSGGKPHPVGDRGQRYEVSVFDENKNERVVVGWTDDAEAARKMADAAALRPSWKFEWVTDRHAVVRESGWLLEKGGLCLGIHEGQHGLNWMPFTLPQALRFARKQDAEAVQRLLIHVREKKGVRVCPSDIAAAVATEHIWEGFQKQHSSTENQK